MIKYFLAFCLVNSYALAQTLSVGFWLSTDLTVEPTITVENLEVDMSKLDLRLASGVSDFLEFGVRLRNSLSLGPIGNAQLEAYAHLNTAAFYDLGVEARGVVASVAARAELALFNAQPGRFEVADAFQTDTRAFTESGSPAGMFALGGSYRMNRNLILSAAPSFYYTVDGFALGLAADSQFIKLFDPDSGRAFLRAYLTAVGEGFGSAGFAYELKRRGLPALTAALWLGAGTAGIYPGLTLAAQQRFRDAGVSYKGELWLEPYRTDVPPYRASLSVDKTLELGELGLSLYSAPFNQNQLSPLVLALHYRYAFD